ncbi:uncharacterized protein LOC133779685 [Humulus lupulus]|uniref:uncharacterized protein LOC133779685 n=1 Tax=Humulus lupulus TaxID=3486 RepID=UPI002B406331|nr:uncharacterized protein LOC133779685 [Humulus lupulus]
MAKGAKVAGKTKSKVKSKKKGPSSSDRIIKTRSMDAILGVKELDIDEEAGDMKLGAEEIFSPADTEDSRNRGEICQNFSDWLSHSNRVAQNVSTWAKTPPPIFRSNIVQNLDSRFSGSIQEKVELEGQHEQSPKSKVKIDFDDIEEEVSYWQPSIVCFVMGANLPLHVLDGFARRMWQDGVVKVGMIARGIFIIRFQNMEQRDRVLQGGYVFFDRKPVVMKPWNPIDDFTKDDITSVPTWVQLKGLDIKYWGEKSLFKIVGQLGTPLQVDNITKHRDRLMYPRILIEVSLGQEFPVTISFTDEFNHDVDLEVKYEWLPLVCYTCSRMGHETNQCRKKQEGKDTVKQKWIPKKQENEVKQKSTLVDEEGFQRVEKRNKVVSNEKPAVTEVANRFDMLDNQEEENWCFTNNNPWLDKGRIVVAWQPSSFDLDIRFCSDQMIHGIGHSKQCKARFSITIVYGFNEDRKRKKLWEDLKEVSAQVQGPWLLIGDFNDILVSNERVGRRSTKGPTQEFRECVDYFFLPEGIFDHSPILFSLHQDVVCGKKPFRYFSMWKGADNFDAKVAQSWNEGAVGTEMFKLTMKLKRLKQVLKSINKEGFSDLQQQALEAKNTLLELQGRINIDPLNSHLLLEEQSAREKFIKLSKAYSLFLAQKAKITWAKNGDDNTAIFHASLRARRIHNRVSSIEDAQGNWCDTPDSVQHAFLHFFQQLLGSQMHQRISVNQSIIDLGPKITDRHISILQADYSAQEVKDAIFAIPGLKSPGPDGFGSSFYQDNWNLVGAEVEKVVLSFLNTGRILKEINATTITIIPKSSCPRNVSDFRPISCCNVIYKAASKIICSRLRKILPDLIAENQGGFVHGRYIAHNIMVCQDLVRLYGRKNCKPSCMLKIDLRKAYDTIEWGFIEEMLKAFGFPQKFTDLVLTCIRTPKFSLLLNGSLHGFFEARRGLRQGDPISPLLFVLGMEYLTRILTKVGSRPSFKYHDRCSTLKLNHLCFADDLLLFCHGDYPSIILMLRGLKLFSKTSGLCPNPSKSAVYCHGMLESDVNRILETSSYTRSSLPFRYLGIPICSKKISAAECTSILEKMTGRIRLWSTRNLSYMGRVTLINSVLISIHSYWAQLMILPKKLLRDVEALCRAFLWKGSLDTHSHGLIAWDHLCLSKIAGGLGFRRILEWNEAAIGKYVWDIAKKKDNLFVKWINSVYIANRSWWDYSCPPDCSWYWKRIVAVKERLKHKVSLGSFVSQQYSIKRGLELMSVSDSKVSWNRNWEHCRPVFVVDRIFCAHRG